MTNLDIILKNRDIALPTKASSGFPQSGSPRGRLLLSALALVPVQDFPHRLVEGVAGDFAAHSSLRRDNRKKLEKGF